MAQTTVHQLEGPVTAKEGDAFQINCTYQTANFYGLAWYQQWEGKAPGLVSYQVAAGQEEYGRFTAFLSTAGKYSLLHLKETWVSDAASYLCAVRDTLTPGPQQGRGAPSFLGTGHDGSSTAGEFTMAVHKASRSTKLTRDGASLSDAGIYYCASRSILFGTPFQVVESNYQIPPHSSLLQTKQSQFPQPLLISHVLQPPNHFCCPLLESFQFVHILLVVWGPKLGTVLRKRSHQCRIEGNDHVPRSAGNAPTYTAQNAVSLLGNKDTLLTISSFSSTVTPRSFSAELAAIRPRTKGWLIPLPCWRKSHVAGDALRMEDRLASWFP
ncbi:uncharacterized protein LOC101936070 [Chrysemys picta bellii]|uniref:uncharacterized protein LOC101936070 n=1 Tax=Chrysemys picta bellii TaxID=8478 RepID=UPI0032B29686